LVSFREREEHFCRFRSRSRLRNVSREAIERTSARERFSLLSRNPNHAPAFERCLAILNASHLTPACGPRERSPLRIAAVHRVRPLTAFREALCHTLAISKDVQCAAVPRFDTAAENGLERRQPRLLDTKA
jgi:hypothetical protein